MPEYEIRQMVAQGGGVIVNMSSVAGLLGFAGAAAYIASKHGVLGLTKTAAWKRPETIFASMRCARRWWKRQWQSGSLELLM